LERLDAKQRNAVEGKIWRRKTQIQLSACGCQAARNSRMHDRYAVFGDELGAQAQSSLSENLDLVITATI